MLNEFANHTHTHLQHYPSLAKTPSPPYSQPRSRLELYPSKANRKPAIKTDSTDPMVRALAATPNTVASAMRAMQANGGMVSSPSGRGIATGTAHSPLNFADDGMDF